MGAKTTTFYPPADLGTILSVSLKASSTDGWYLTKLQVNGMSMAPLPFWLDGKPYDKTSSYKGAAHGDKVTLKPAAAETLVGVGSALQAPSLPATKTADEEEMALFEDDAF